MLSIIIPAYNEADNILETLQEAQNALSKALGAKEYEMIVIDDHSSDDTYRRVVSLGDPRTFCIRLSRRSGSPVAVRVGLAEAKGDAVLCLAADGQDDPSVLGSMLDRWRQGHQVVLACRHSRQLESLMYRLTTGAFYNFLAFVCNLSVHEKYLLSHADFFLLDRKVVEALKACEEKHTSLFGLILWGGFQQTFIEYTRKARRSGKSKWNFNKRMTLAKDWILAFSGLPIVGVLLTGILITIISILYIFVAYAILGRFSVVGAIFLMGGLQLTALGIIGEYVWAALKESRRRPLCFIEKRSSEGKD